MTMKTCVDDNIHSFRYSLSILLSITIFNICRESSMGRNEGSQLKKNVTLSSA